MTTGARQEVELDRTGSINYRLILNGVETTLLSATVAIYRGDTETVPSTAASTSGAVATYNRTWDASTFTRGKVYRAAWTLVHAGGTETRQQFFQVVRRGFFSQVADSDITALDQGIANKLVAGDDLEAFRERAWREIRRSIDKLYSRRLREYDASAGDVFFPGEFFDAHIALTRAYFYQQDAYDAGPDTTEWMKYQELLKEGRALLEETLSNIDIDLDSDLAIEETELDRTIQPRLIR